MNGLLHTLLDLGDATSRNLAFAHRPKVHVSYGEETITETNLLELRRRHPDVLHLETFSKKKESENGADWEWHIVGRALTLKLRVQAKRLQRNGVLKINHTVSSTKKQQMEMLIDEAAADGCRPVYCLYCTEDQRNVWKATTSPIGAELSEYGCLLVDAEKAKSLKPSRLSEIEAECVPWHYLAFDARYAIERFQTRTDAYWHDTFTFLVASKEELVRISGPSGRGFDRPVPVFPNFDDLNGPSDREFDRRGVIETSEYNFDREVSRVADREMKRIVKLDIREIMRSERDD